MLAAGKPRSGRQTPRSRSFSLARPCLRSAEAHVMGTGLVPPSESARVGGPPPGAVGARARALGGRGLGRPSGSPWELSRGSALQGGPLGPAPPTVAGRPPGMLPAALHAPCTWPCCVDGRGRGDVPRRSQPVPGPGGLRPEQPLSLATPQCSDPAPGLGPPAPRHRQLAGVRVSFGPSACTVSQEPTGDAPRVREQLGWGGRRRGHSTTDGGGRRAFQPARAARLRMKQESLLFLLKRNCLRQPQARGPRALPAAVGQAGFHQEFPPLCPPSSAVWAGTRAVLGTVRGDCLEEAAAPRSPCLASER